MTLNYTKSNLPVTWNNEIESFNWKETYMIGEVPSDDIWINFATEKKLELEEIYRNLNMPVECSKHYMSLNPKLSSGLELILQNFQNNKFHYNFLKLTPGYNLWWHYDSYSTFVKYNNISEEDAHKINRTVVMMTPWVPGQVFQIENDALINWEIGTTYTWPSYTWHGVGNFSFSDFIVMQITWI